jgi:hypothetical protein
MFFELRSYRTKPDMRDKWVKLMDEVIIPFQSSKGMVIIAGFVGETDPDSYIWIRRFESEEERVRQYAAVYETDFWKNEITPQVSELLDRSATVVTRLNPTPRSIIR